MSNGLLEKILDKCTTIEKVQRGLPTEDRVRIIIREEQQNCPAFRGFGEVSKQSSENAGILKVIGRRSIAPAARAVTALPRWAQILIGIISASGIGTAVAAALQ